MEYLYMNKETGELMTGSQAIKEFFRVPRGHLDNWLDAYERTSEIDTSPIENPTALFIKAVKI